MNRSTQPFMNRRRFLGAMAGATLLPWAAPVMGETILARPSRVLFFTKSSGWEHDGVKRHDGNEGWAETTFRAIAEKVGVEVTVTKDGGVFDRDDLRDYSAFVFYTSGDLTLPGTDRQPPMTPAGKRRMLDQIEGGISGFVGIHSAADTFRGDGKPGSPRDPYAEMLGGRFTAHGDQQKATSRVVETRIAGLETLRDFEMNEEWYAFDWHAKDLRVILEQQSTGMKGAMYQRPPYPSTWTRRHGKGRVYYTSMGHRQDVWEGETFRKVVAAGVRWACGQGEG